MPRHSPHSISITRSTGSSMANTLVPERLVVIGASAGGVSALRHLLGALEPDFNWPIVIVLHIGSSNVDHLVEVLAATSALPVIEARPGAAPRPGTVHVAPGGYHLLIEDDRRRSDEHPSELQSLMRISYAVFSLEKNRQT